MKQKTTKKLQLSYIYKKNLSFQNILKLKLAMNRFG